MKAYEVLENYGWVQGTEARDRDGNDVPPLDDQAVCFCLQGAIRRSTGGDNEFEKFRISNEKVQTVLNGKLGPAVPGTTWEWNDTPGRTKEEVIAVLREADV